MYTMMEGKTPLLTTTHALHFDAKHLITLDLPSHIEDPASSVWILDCSAEARFLPLQLDTRL